MSGRGIARHFKSLENNGYSRQALGQNSTKGFFIDMKPEEVKERKAKVEKVKTLHGIKSRFQYICLPDGKV